MREIIVTRREEGQRLDRFLLKYLPEASSGFLHKMLRKKNIKLNQGRAGGGERLEEGDRITIYFSEKTLARFMGQNGEEGSVPDRDARLSQEEAQLRSRIQILYQDENLLLVNKPAGMLTQKAKPEDDSLNDYLIDRFGTHPGMTGKESAFFKPAAANRLDRNTGGVVLCGLSTRGLQDLSVALRERSLGKYYLCLVRGSLKGRRRLQGWLFKDEKKNQAIFYPAGDPRGSERGAYIETEYRVLRTGERGSLLCVKLITGKTHQIRLHLASAGHPILGDFKYGDRNFNMEAKRTLGIRAQMLHSYRVVFPPDAAGTLRPLSGKTIEAPLPEDFIRAQRWLGLRDK